MKNIQRSIGKSITALIMVLLGSSMIYQAGALTLTDKVFGKDNLYSSEWGHWFTMEGDGALAAYAPKSTAASAIVDSSNNAYNFSSWDYLDIAVTGSVTDAGRYETGADGCSDPTAPCWFGDGQFRGQDVYSAIGIWSSSADEISWLDTIYDNWFDAVFTVGSDASIEVPEIEGAYLFLAENDGVFADNSGFYTATITTSVPEPASALLMLTALLGLFAIRRQRRAV